ncbi:MAG: UPF0158 family protein [Proteobacteria bacterium]|nr:UPF0158 family protein [Pseudomonadota bacterium]
MKKISYDAIDTAIMFVSVEPFFTSQALISKHTGEIFYASEFGDSEGLPDDFENEKKYIDVPHEKELGLGQPLVFDFVSEYIPDHEDTIHRIFRGPGAYSRYKEFLDDKGLLDKWYEFENRERKEAIMEWCHENGIEPI